MKLFYANGTHAEYCQQDPAIPVAIMSVLDYGWFILLLFATPLLPYSALNVPTSLVIDENAKLVGRLARRGKGQDRPSRARAAASAREQAKIAGEKAKAKGKEAAVKAGAMAGEVRNRCRRKWSTSRRAISRMTGLPVLRGLMQPLLWCRRGDFGMGESHRCVGAIPLDTTSSSSRVGTRNCDNSRDAGHSCVGSSLQGDIVM